MLIIKGDMPSCCGACKYIKSPAGFNGNTLYDGCYLNDELDIQAEERHEDCPILAEISDKHGRLVDIDKMIVGLRGKYLPINIESADELADLLETYADLDKTDHIVVVEATE